MVRIALWPLVLLACALALVAGLESTPMPPEQALIAFMSQIASMGVLLWAAHADLRTTLVPRAAPWALAVIQLVYCMALWLLLGLDASWLLGRSALGALVLGGTTLALALALEHAQGRDALGGGDIKLLFALGFSFGWERGMVMLALACTAFLAWAASRQLLGCFLSRVPAHVPQAVLLAPLAAAPDERALPFVPALAAGSFFTMLCF